MAMGGGGSTYRSADGIWHAAIDIEPDRSPGAGGGPRQDQGGGEREAQDEDGRIRAQGLHAELAVAVPHGLAGDWYHERAEANLRPNSRRSYENAIVRLNRIAGARRINSLGHKGHGRHSGRLKCYSPKTATITWSVLKNALEAARDENLIRRNPAKMVRPVSASSSSPKVNPPSLPDAG